MLRQASNLDAKDATSYAKLWNDIYTASMAPAEVATFKTMAEIFRAQVVDTSTEHFVFEVTGKASKIETFIGIMRELGLTEVSRTGIAAIGRGAATL